MRLVAAQALFSGVHSHRWRVALCPQVAVRAITRLMRVGSQRGAGGISLERAERPRIGEAMA